jgi:hypothetical protein
MHDMPTPEDFANAISDFLVGDTSNKSVMAKPNDD